MGEAASVICLAFSSFSHALSHFVTSRCSLIPAFASPQSPTNRVSGPPRFLSPQLWACFSASQGLWNLTPTPALRGKYLVDGQKFLLAPPLLECRSPFHSPASKSGEVSRYCVRVPCSFVSVKFQDQDEVQKTAKWPDSDHRRTVMAWPHF